jgi:hypothetical protein
MASSLLQNLPDQVVSGTFTPLLYDEVQLELLDAEFARDSFPNREGRRHIAQLIGVSEKSIMVQHFLFDLLN